MKQQILTLRVLQIWTVEGHNKTYSFQVVVYFISSTVLSASCTLLHMRIDLTDSTVPGGIHICFKVCLKVL